MAEVRSEPVLSVASGRRFKILTYNNIAVAGLERLPRSHYEVASEMQHPDAIVLRSADLHQVEVAASVMAVGRAGAGVNNIPVDRMSERGVAVFNTPGANANAVKELAIAGMFLAARNICQAWAYAASVRGSDESIHREVEAGKRAFVGFELPGRTLGVIGLGAIGVLVANTALRLGMRVIGYDPGITVSRAWQLSAEVGQSDSVEGVLKHADMVSLHVPLVAQTANLINAERMAAMRDGATVLNFSRAGIVDDAAMVDALASGKLHAYVCDFPSAKLADHPRVITLPHIGASTREAEENCAIMVADQVRAFLEDGTVHNSVNFPDASMPRNGGNRLAVVNRNVPNMLGQISTTLAQAELNILDMLNKSRGDLAYTLIDVDRPASLALEDALRAIDGVLSVRAI